METGLTITGHYICMAGYVCLFYLVLIMQVEIDNASQVIGIAIFGIYGTRIQWRRRREREKTLHVLMVTHA